MTTSVCLGRLRLRSQLPRVTSRPTSTKRSSSASTPTAINQLKSVLVVGGAGGNGADIRGLMPDGRSFVIQCKRCTPSSPIASREMRDLLGARVHFKADLAVFGTTPAALAEVNGAGQGDRRHQAR